MVEIGGKQSNKEREKRDSEPTFFFRVGTRQHAYVRMSREGAAIVSEYFHSAYWIRAKRGVVDKTKSFSGTQPRCRMTQGVPHSLHESA